MYGIKTAIAQEEKEDRVLLLMDASGGMQLPWKFNGSKYAAASQTIAQLIDSIYAVNADVQFGLRVYGQLYAEKDANCKDSRLEVRFTKDNAAQTALRLLDLTPKGVAALPYALGQAVKGDITDTQFRQSIIFITGNTYRCEGELCALLTNKAFYRIYVLDFAGVGYELSGCANGVFEITNPIKRDSTVKYIAKQFARKKRQQPVPKTLVQPPVTFKKEVIEPMAILGYKGTILKTTSVPRLPARYVEVPYYYWTPEPEPETEVLVPVYEQIVEETPEELTPDEVEPSGVRISTNGWLLFKSSPQVLTLKIYKLSRGKEHKVKTMEINGKAESEIELEKGSYKANYMLRDGTEVTQAFRVEEFTITEVNSK